MNSDLRATLSVILPIFNEESVIPALFQALTPLLTSMSPSYEIICVNDGSTDRSPFLLQALAAQDQHIKIINFSRNFGHQMAITAGLDHSSGQAVLIMDADLQDPPEILPQFIAQWRQGYEVVYAVRRGRKEGLWKRLAYAVFYRTMKAMADINVPLDAGDFCLLDRCVVDVLVALPERHRFLRGLRSWVGFRQIGIEYERGARHSGAPKYTLRQLIRLALAGYIGFSSMPLHAAGWLGFFTSGLGAVLTLWALVTKMLGIPSPQGWASILSVVLFMGGIQLVMLGVVGEYLGRVYDEVRQRPLYIVRSRVGFARADTTVAIHGTPTDITTST